MLTFSETLLSVLKPIELVHDTRCNALMLLPNSLLVERIGRCWDRQQKYVGTPEHQRRLPSDVAARSTPAPPRQLHAHRPPRFAGQVPAGSPNTTTRSTLGNRDATYARTWLSVDWEILMATAISRPPRPSSWTLTSKAAPALPSSGRHVRAPTLPFCTRTPSNRPGSWRNTGGAGNLFPIRLAAGAGSASSTEP